MYRWGHHRVTLDDLIGFAWSAPMRELAAQIGLSDVGLKKLLKSHGVWHASLALLPVRDLNKAIKDVGCFVIIR